MKVIILLSEDQMCVAWTEYYAVLKKDDPEFKNKVLELCKKNMPYLNLKTVDDIVIKFPGEENEGSYVYHPYGIDKKYRHYIFEIIEEEI